MGYMRVASIYPIPKYDFFVISLDIIAGSMNIEDVDIIAKTRSLDSPTVCLKKMKYRQ